MGFSLLEAETPAAPAAAVFDAASAFSAAAAMSAAETPGDVRRFMFD